ncbi:MAG: maltose ABC transporter substrate-binding protein [Clostridiaceae bacterium]|nr:maltose ABC transporter substrate-binding protein [Clostridiaceae bacterium]
MIKKIAYKRLLPLLITVVMMLGVIAGCGTDTKVVGETETDDAPVRQTPPATDTPDQPAEPDVTPEPEGLQPEPGAVLKIWDSEGPEGNWLMEVTKQFTDKYGVEVTYEPVGHTDSPAKMKTDGPAGLGADVFSAPHDHLGGLVTAGLVYPNDVSDPAEYMDAAVQGTSYDGVWYGYPVAIETYALFYNKDLVAEPPKTFDELITFSKSFNDIKNNKYGFMMEAANFYYIYSFMSGYGGYVFGNNGTNRNDIGLNSPGAVEALKFHQSLKEILPLNTADINYDIKSALFNEGNLAFDIDGPWAIRGHMDAGVNFGIAPLPLLPNGKNPQSFSGIRAFYVNSYTKYSNAAMLLAQFLTSKELLADRFTNTNQIPPRKDLLDDPAIKNDEYSAAILNQAQYAQAMPNIPEMSSVWTPMATALEENWNKGGDPKPLLDNAVNSIQDALAAQSQ